MKPVLTFLFFVFFVVEAIAQNTMPDRVVAASAGRDAIPTIGFSISNNKRMTYTIGEPLIYRGLVGNKYIHNGFEQPDALIAVAPGVVMLQKPDSPFKVYPNPMTSYSIVEAPEEQLNPVKLQLLDMNAKLIAEYTMESTRLQIDLENTLTAGSYLLNFYTIEGQFIQQNKLIKQ